MHIYLCPHICIYTFVRTQVHFNICIYTHVNIYTCICIFRADILGNFDVYVYILENEHLCVFIYICMYVSVCIYMHACTNIYTYINMYICMHVHIELMFADFYQFEVDKNRTIVSLRFLQARAIHSLTIHLYSHKIYIG